MASPQDWGAIPVENPTAWGAKPVGEPASPLERVGRGAQDVIDRLAQLTVAAGEKLGHYQPGLGDVMTKQMNDENQQYTHANPGFSVARAAGTAGMLAPVALLPGGSGIAARAVTGAEGGALSGLMQYDPTSTLGGSARNTAVGAGIGTLAGPIFGAAGDKASEGLSWLAGRSRGLFANKASTTILKQVPEIASLPQEAQRDLIKEAQAQISRTGNLNTDEVSRKANLLANGLTPTKSIVTRDPTDWTIERNLQKLAQSPDEQLSSIGQDITRVYQANDAAGHTRLASLQDGLPKGSPEAQGMMVMKSIDELSRASQKDVSKLYEQVRQNYGDDLASDAKSLFLTIDDLKDSPAADQITGAATRRLTKLGMLDKDGNLTSNTLTVKQAEGLRQFINQQPYSYGKSQIVKAIDQDVLHGAGADAFSGARSEAARRFQMLDNPTTQKALNTLGELGQGKTAQNFIQQQVINAPEQDVHTLLATIDKSPSAKAARDAIASGVMQHLESKAVNPLSGQMSGANFQKAINSIGDAKLDAILGADKAQQVRSLSRAMLDATYQPPYSAVNNSNTAPMLLSLTQRARAIPGIPLVVSEEAQKLAASAGYQGQLKDVMEASLSGHKSGLSPELSRQLSRLLSGASVPASNAVFDKARQ